MSLWTKLYDVTIQMKALYLYFNIMLFVCQNFRKWNLEIWPHLAGLKGIKYCHSNKLYPFQALKVYFFFWLCHFFSFLLLSTISFSHNFVVCNRYPFGLLVKFKLWNLTIFKISIVFQRLSGRLPMFVFVFAKKLARISLEIVLVPR